MIIQIPKCLWQANFGQKIFSQYFREEKILDVKNVSELESCNICNSLLEFHKQNVVKID